MDVKKKEEVTFDSVEYFVHRLSHLLALRTPGELDMLQEEFVSYQLLRDTDIPTQILEEAKFGEDEAVYYRIDILLGHYVLCKMKEIGSSELKFRRLAEVAKAVLVIPHSNASEERCLAWFAKTKHHFILVLGLIECCHQ